MRRMHAICQHPAGNDGAICGKNAFARNFCHAHYQFFRAACIRNGSWSRGVDSEVMPPRPRFAFEGDEDTLAAMTAKAPEKGDDD